MNVISPIFLGNGYLIIHFAVMENNKVILVYSCWVIFTQPRCVAAISVAKRVSKEMDMVSILYI